jgi:hypothetical protein
MFMILAGLNHIRETLLGNLATYNAVTTIPDLLIPCTLGWLLLRLFQVEMDNANEPAPLQKL